jgi:predicted RND superfamily exporter protein
MADRNLNVGKYVYWLVIACVGFVLFWVVGIAIMRHLRLYVLGTISCTLAVAIIIVVFLELRSKIRDLREKGKDAKESDLSAG